MTPEMLCDYACLCGENPLWHPFEKRLYWTDIDTGRMFWFDPRTGKHQPCYEGRKVGGFTVQADGSMLLFMDRGTVAVFKDGRIVRTVIEEIEAEVASRFNDVIADPQGRVFCGTMSTKQNRGRLYRLDRDAGVRVLLEGVACSNGMGFSPDLSRLYHIDSPTLTVWEFDYDRATGELSNRRSLIQTPQGMGVPDGMTVDARGRLWVAFWDGHRSVCYGPDGAELRTIDFPVKKVSSVTFGGERLDEAYFTSAGGDRKQTNGAAAGGLFRIKGLAEGKPEFLSRVGI